MIFTGYSLGCIVCLKGAFFVFRKTQTMGSVKIYKKVNSELSILSVYTDFIL